MAGFFSLGGGGSGNDNPRSSGRQQQQPPPPLQEVPPETWFWSRSGHPQNQGFELWQQQQQHHMGGGGFVIRQQEEEDEQDLYALGVGVGPPSSSRAASDQGGGRGAAAARVVGGICCQDCGNQAKKDCPHLRCRTCCKSRGLECQTHVKSTWVPAAKRRERQQQVSALKHHPPPTHFRSSSTAGEASKRPRDNLTPTATPESPMDCTNTNANTGLELGANFPAELSSAALFRCVRVTSGDESEDQYAYQTAVTIGGHVFRGILYDCGPEPSSYGHNLITVASHAVAVADTSGGGVPTSAPLLYDHSTSASPLYTAVAATAPITTYTTSTMASGTHIFPHHHHRP